MKTLHLLVTGPVQRFGLIVLSILTASLVHAQPFTNINAGLPGMAESSAAWADYDNDGRLDILLAGASSAQVWRNTTGGFANINAGLPNVQYGAAVWGDYDNDGRQDILLTGFSSGEISQVWRNTGSGFTNI